MKKLFIALSVSILVCGLAPIVEATPITFTGASGNLSASVTFDTSGTNFIVTLTNTSLNDVLVPADVLTGIFFTIPGNLALTRISAVLGTGSSVFYDPDGQPPGGVVGGEWAYKNGLLGAPGGANQGISSSGFGLFGSFDLFPGADLAPPVSPDGLNYGILSAGDNTLTGNTGVTGKGGEIKNSVIFTLGGLPINFNLATISNVNFQYGTALNEPNIPVPEPSTLLLLGAGLIGFGILGRKRLKRKE